MLIIYTAKVNTFNGYCHYSCAKIRTLDLVNLDISAILVVKFLHLNNMTKIKIGDDWWTTPTESDNGNRIIVTGRRNMEMAIASGKFTDRIEVTWKYVPTADGMPDTKTSTIMETVTDALNDAFKKDQAAIMTGIYTGDGERNWIFYTRNLSKFQWILNSALNGLPLLPLEFYAEKDSEWNEYQEMRLKTEISEGE